MSVPLDLLWSCCPKVSSLSGSLSNLKYLLMDNPEVKLSQDGAAVLVNDQEQGAVSICSVLFVFIECVKFQY